MKSNKMKFNSVSEKEIKKGRLHNREDLAYMKSLSSAVLEKSAMGSRLILWTIVLSIAWLILWADHAEIDEITRGSGKVIPTHKTQVIQNLEGGIVEDVFIKEGDIVKKNQPLIKLRDIRFSSSYEENKLKVNELEAKAIRLKAEAENKHFETSNNIDESFKKLLENEKSLYDSNMRQLASSLGIVQSQLNQRKSELIEAKAKRNQFKRSLELIEEEIEFKEPLVKRGVVPSVDFIKLKREKNDIAGSLESAKLSIPRILSTIRESQKKYKETKLIFQNKAKKELNDVSAELTRTRESILALSDRVDRTVVRSPVTGIIQQLFVNTKGGVIQPGKDIVEIVPLEDKLLIEAKIKPKDIAFLHVGQKATIKFTAYDFGIYGGLKGEVSHISADTITEDKKTYYVVYLKAERNYLIFKKKKLFIKVGMVTSSDILTGKKTILDYLLKPILKAKDSALRER